MEKNKPTLIIKNIIEIKEKKTNEKNFISG